MTLPTPQEAERMTGADVIEVLRKVLDDERTECAQLADGMAERLMRSGKLDHATVALQVAAQIRARRK